MKTEGKHLQSFGEVSQQLRAQAWAIVEDWLDKSKLSRLSEETSSDSAPDIIENLPTLIGGVAKVIQDPMFLMDLEAGGNLFFFCRQFGQFLFDAGYRIDKVMNDFSLLRQELWLFCECIVSSDGDLLELSRRLNSAIDRMAAVTVEAYHTRSSAELIELAQKDKLTGFMHMEAFQRRLTEEMRRAVRYRYPLSLISLDIDDFRRYNLEEGRFEGNRLLRHIAREISGVVRRTDIAARFSGDEFAVIMPQTASPKAKNAGERIRRSVRRLRRGDQPITVSLGVAAFPKAADEKDALIKATRGALAEAKQNGGNVVRVAK